MKIAHENNTSKKDALSTLLKNVRDTPQQATGLAPGAMMFRDGYRSTFPRASASTQQILDAQMRDTKQKKERESKINASKFRKETQISVGDIVILRNLDKRKKFDPHFTLEKYSVIDRKIFSRHPDDIKVLQELQRPIKEAEEKKMSEYEEIQLFAKQFEAIKNTDDDIFDIDVFENRGPEVQEITAATREMQQQEVIEETSVEEETAAVELRRSGRSTKPNPKYFSQDFKN